MPEALAQASEELLATKFTGVLNRPVPASPSRRDFTDAALLFKALAAIAHALDKSLRTELAAALLSCEEPMRAYARHVRSLKALEKLGRKGEGW